MQRKETLCRTHMHMQGPSTFMYLTCEGVGACEPPRLCTLVHDLIELELCSGWWCRLLGVVGCLVENGRNDVV